MKERDFDRAACDDVVIHALYEVTEHNGKSMKQVNLMDSKDAAIFLQELLKRDVPGFEMGSLNLEGIGLGSTVEEIKTAVARVAGVATREELEAEKARLVS